jgi:hypothetical protein
MRVKLGALLAGMCALTIGFAAPAGAGQVLQMTVNPTSGVPGSSFTVSGTGCGPPPVHVSVTVHFVPEGLTQGSVEVNQSGGWSTNFTVPADAQPGTVVVDASCISDNNQTNAVAVAVLSGGPRSVPLQVSGYPPGAFTVLAPATTPATAPAVADPAAAVASAPRTTG